MLGKNESMTNFKAERRVNTTDKMFNAASLVHI